MSSSATFEHTDDLDAINKLYRERRWSDGLPIVPPTRERVARMLACTKRKPDEVVAKLAPGFGEATVERIAINAVMAGCDPEYLPVLIAAPARWRSRSSICKGWKPLPIRRRCGWC